MLNPRLKAAAEKLLPRFLLAWLDPFQEAIESEVRAAAAGLRDGQRVLDAGAGEGRHRRHFSRGRYLAVDAGVGDSAWNYSRLDARADLENLPFAAASVDAALCMVVLEHTRNPGRVIAEFARVLRPGATLYMVIPFLWEEHQAPHDYWRFTRYGARLLFEGLPFRLDLLEPVGGIFRVCARRCLNLLSVFQGGWRWLLFVPLAPLLGLLLPLVLHFLDGLDRTKNFSLGFRLRATREST